MNISQIDFEKTFWESYLKILLTKYACDHKINYTENGLKTATSKLAELLVEERAVFSCGNTMIGGQFNTKAWLTTKISTINFN